MSIPAVAQGIQTVLTVQIVDGNGTAIDFSATSPALTAEVWPGSTLPVTFSPTAAWNNATLGLVDVTFTAANTASVAPGFFQLRIRATDNSTWLYQGNIEIVSSPSNATVTLADLCTIPYAHAALSSQSFSDDEWQYLPYAIKSASDAIRKYCAQTFNRGDYTETLRPELDGAVRLREIPVNSVSRVASGAADAITISCSSTTNQQARVVFSTTGNRGEPGGITVTGLTLTRVASGVTTTNTLLWADYPLISDLATAINALGGGWSATVPTTFAPWLTSELVGAETAQGCLVDEGATLQVYATDLDTTRTDYDAGFLWVGWPSGSYRSSVNGWPFWPSTDNYSPYRSEVRVNYNAGYDTIPATIQSACAQLAAVFLFRFRQNPLFKGETAHQYRYEFRDVIRALPSDVLQSLNLYRVTNA